MLSRLVTHALLAGYRASSHHSKTAHVFCSNGPEVETSNLVWGVGRSGPVEPQAPGGGQPLEFVLHRSIPEPKPANETSHTEAETHDEASFQ